MALAMYLAQPLKSPSFIIFLAISNFSIAAPVFDSSARSLMIKLTPIIPEEHPLLLWDEGELGEGGS